MDTSDRTMHFSSFILDQAMEILLVSASITNVKSMHNQPLKNGGKNFYSVEVLCALLFRGFYFDLVCT